ncbi:response regulator [Arenibacter sp. GZD96]|uniref:response regulator n=1 Tax=Aurantibrevibacter litoralis TaxID=3106030 RepID=UPI002AFEAA86|nr:response regulator [Arenibacter sp. GZD-96]MEA1787332.1 response regulator [Arenibacter sp. GZD-96]
MYLTFKAENNEKGIYAALWNKATYYYNQSKMDSVSQTLHEALRLAENSMDNKKIVDCYIRLASVETKLGHFEASKELTFKAFEVAKKENHWENLYKIYNKLGNDFFYENKMEQALMYYLKVDSIFHAKDKQETALASALSNIGNIYMGLKNYDKAETYFNRSSSVFKSLGHVEGENHIMVKLGQLLWNSGQYRASINKLGAPLQYYKTAGNLNELTIITNWIGAGYLKLKEYGEAKHYFEASLDYALEAGDQFWEANGLVNLAEISRLEKQPDISIPYLQKAWEIYENMNITYNSPQILKLLSQSYEQKKDFKTALSFARQYQQLTDSLTILENSKSLQEIEAKYQTEKKEQEIALLKAENAVKETQKLVYIGLVAFLLIAFAVIYWIYSNKLKTAKKIKELNDLKSRFFANISHEFRTPLTLIKSPVQNLRIHVDASQKAQLDMIENNSNRMLELVDQLLELSKIDSGSLQLILKQGNLSSFLESLVSPFEYQSKEVQKPLVVHIEKTTSPLFYDKDVIEKIVSNLLSNALKYGDTNESIHFESKILEAHLQLIISNKSSDLTPNDVSKLFERFYQSNTNNDGAGIGLALVKELVQLYEGKIDTNLNSNQLTFTVTLPLRSNLKHAVVTTTPREFDHLPIETGENTQDLPILLVVDDHPEIRTIIASIFEVEFKVIFATNGKEALVMAQREIPDCIVSDIMMPEMDGFEFSKQLKNNELTSFIPIVLLTAKTSAGTHLEALQSTADAFLTKPFSHDVLKATVKQQIQERKKLQAHYSQELILKPTGILINSVDERFINRLQEVFQEEFANPDFNTELFASKMAISRMQLHRKLKSLFGVSATEFVRNERLKTAADLMKNKKLSISEIAYGVGFNDLFYFSKCFKELYKVAPSEYQKSL